MEPPSNAASSGTKFGAEYTMNATIGHATPTPMMPQRHRQTDAAVAAGVADSPYAPYLLHWLGHQAVRHQDLLLNIAAASRIGLVPAGLGR
jgi:hypothetical protein